VSKSRIVLVIKAAASRELFLCVCILISSSPNWALDPQKALTQFYHTSWVPKDGFDMPPIGALAQTEDGYLWIGTNKGLWRFDGLRFFHWQPAPGETLPGDEISALHPARGGGLWIGSPNGISRLLGGRLTTFPIPGAIIRTLFQNRAGDLWAGMSGSAAGLARLSGDRMLRFGLRDGLPDSRVTSIFEDRKGSLWVGTRGGLCRWSPGRPEVYLSSPPVEIYGVTEDDSGHLIVTTSGNPSVLRLNGGRFEPALHLSVRAGIFPRIALRDRDGTIWMGTVSEGLLRVRNATVDRFTRKDGLSGSGIDALLEDREGNLWIGTRGGLDRVRDSKMTRFSTGEGLSDDLVTAVASGASDVVWAGTAGAGLNRIENGVVTQLQSGLPGRSILSVYQSSKDDVWVGTTGGLAVLKSGRFVPVLGPGRIRLDRVTVITRGLDETVWIADARQGLFRIVRGVVEPVTVNGISAIQSDIYSLLSDQQGRLWIGCFHNNLTMLSGTALTRFTPANGGLPGAVLSLTEDAGGSIWAAGPGGVGRFREGRWTVWNAKSGLPDSGVQAVIEDRVGGIWLTSSKVLLRADAAELRSQPDGHPKPIRFDIYDFVDGIRARADIVRSQPQVAKSPNGALWFAGDYGVGTIQPARLQRNTLPPPVVVESFKAAGREFDLANSHAGDFSFQTRELQFDFTALSLTAPETIRFRYRLEGYDPHWVDAGSRRQAFYTNLPPGSYRFAVIACNNEGICGQSKTALNVVLLPPFYLRWWFQITCVFLFSAILLAIYRMRLSQIAHQFELRVQARLGERNRIARELHDTLLQSVVGISLQLKAMSQRLPEDNQDREGLERLRRHVDSSIREARQSVMALRSPASARRDLITAFQEQGATATAGQTIRFHMSTEGTPQSFPPELEEQLLRIGQEAFANAVSHSRCSHLHLHLTCTRRSIQLRIADNGTGIDPETLAAGRPGHFGLRGMKERAESMGGQLEIASQAGKGVAITLTVPLHPRSGRAARHFHRVASAAQSICRRPFRRPIDAAGAPDRDSCPGRRLGDATD